MKESLQNAKQELKRADHLIFVSLKYTRTVDVIKSIIERLINCLDQVMNSLLNHAKEQKQITETPTLARIKAEVCKNLYAQDPTIQNYIAFYQLLRKIDKAQFERTQEYRRHVTMTAHLDEGHVELTIDIIQDYFHRTKEFIIYVEKLLIGEHEQ